MVRRFSRCCCGSGYDCSDACPDSGPDEFEVVIDGITPISCGTGDCEAINDTYILTRVENCLWRIDLSNSETCFGPLTGIELEITAGAGVYSIAVRYDFSGSTGTSAFTKGSQTANCNDISSLSLNFFGNIFFPQCQHSSSTCTITAL